VAYPMSSVIVLAKSLVREELFDYYSNALRNTLLLVIKKFHSQCDQLNSSFSHSCST